ncbi:MAG TPA: hypothetical protein VG123_26490, partial [Streptosporangiaceae bacterium]|nr:hypothetical protein [Streptosporangiaceae bacterium]
PREGLGPDDAWISLVRRECLKPGRSFRNLGRPMRVRFITDLPKGPGRARARIGRVVSLAGVGGLGLSLGSMVSDSISRIIGKVADMCGRRWCFPAGPAALIRVSRGTHCGNGGGRGPAPI